MKKYIYIIGIALLTVGVLPSFSQVSNDNEDEVNKIDTRWAKNDFVPGQVLVKFKDASRVQVNASRGQFRSTSIDRVTQVLQKYGTDEMEQLLPNENPNRKMRRAKAYNGDVIQERDLSQLYLVKLSADHLQETMQMVDELKAIDEVEYAEPNYRVYMMADTHIADDYSDNPFEKQQWYLDAYGVKELWNKPIINKERPVIAILDTGVDLTHPDLKDNLWTNTLEAYGTTDNDNDGNGFKNDVHGWDFVNNSANIRDNNMHGTHVAGIAAAANNGIGIVGANPLALIMPITVLQSDGSGDVATIIKGIDYAVINGATVLNMSLGTYVNSLALRHALENAYSKAVLVAAAGNDNKCVNTYHFPKPHREPAPMPCFPAAYSFVLGVQATVNGGELAPYSNYDDDGPNYSEGVTYFDPDGFNYEMKVPGSQILSTIPGGRYKSLNGTSMSAPLAAGAISALKMVKQYNTQELLWGDLLHTSNIAEAYNLTARPAELDLIRVELRNRKDLSELTEEDYSGDNEVDAGEIISIYPVIRTTWGPANNIKLRVMVDEFEDPDAIEILSNDVDFGIRLDAYGKAVSQNPLVLRIPNNIADARHIRLKLEITCDEMIKKVEYPFVLVAHNMIKISGLINEDKTLTANHVYYVNGDLGVNKGVTLTIEPGTRLEFAGEKSLVVFGKLVAKGTPERPITFTRHVGDGFWRGIYGNQSDTMSYCRIEDCNLKTRVGQELMCMTDCVFDNCHGRTNGARNVYMNGSILMNNVDPIMKHTNFVNNVSSGFKYPCIYESNFFNNGKNDVMYGNPFVEYAEHPSYLGTSREDLARSLVYSEDSWGIFDLSNMPKEPIREAHGIVWKVLVNGKDAQDEFEDLAPLGIGRHKFEVYFSQPMNKSAIPLISFGIRSPFTQQSVAEDAGWNEDGTIYTAYKTITGNTRSDGLNHIYVQGAEDAEYFPCPYEKSRFSFIIQATGSMSTGFMAENGLGCVKLTWNQSSNQHEDAMGYNVYRYHQVIIPAGWRDGIWHDEELGNDTIWLNQEILDIETTSFIDSDVEPGKTYYYYYKVISTDLQEYDKSNVVAATPLTSKRGDANGSGDVDVADVITTVNYITRQEPKPFIFEAADMNEDNIIDVLDVVDIIRGILNPSLLATASVNEESAIYTIENGVLYVESPVALAGVQAQLSLDGRCQMEDVRVAADSDGFEQASAWLTDNDYLFMAYSMSGKTLTPGKHALLYIGDADLSSLRLSDTQGHNVAVVAGEGTTKIDAIGSKVMTAKGIYNLNGQKLNSDKLRKGVYIIDGIKVVK